MGIERPWLVCVRERESDMELEKGKREKMGDVESDEVVTTKYKQKMETPKKFALLKDWQGFKEFFEKDKEALMEPVDWAENTAIQVAARSNYPRLVKELLEMLSPRERWFVLRKGNAHRNTILHQVIYNSNVQMVDALLDYYRNLTPPPDPEEEEEERLPLLELTNDLGETPVYRAAKYGRLEILKHMVRYVDDIHKHFPGKVDKTSILHVAILGQYFDVAMWLVSRVRGMEVLVNKKDENGLTCLQLLSQMPSVFRSGSHMGFVEKLIYSILPEEGFEDCDEIDEDNSCKVVKQQRDLESGEDKVKQPAASVLSRINYAIWRFLAGEYEEINLIWKRKKQHKLAEKLANYLVQNDNSWQIRRSHAKPKKEVQLPVIYPFNVTSGKNKAEQQKQAMSGKSTHSFVPAPLFLAASTGIIEIVKRTIEVHPEAIAYVEDEENVLHVAVKHRQRKIYRLIKRYGALKWLAAQITDRGQTLLHQVAGMDYYKGGNQAGVVFQLQDELRWFYRVKKAIPAPFILHCNDDLLTARQLFDIQHNDMLKAAQDWIKGTAQSCSAVAVLVATVVFAAAYTVPGGTDDHGIPRFLGSTLFLFFTIMDVVALASSLISVMMFLSVLTSPFEINDFHISLPRKLTLGFTLLFFSLTTTMLAFGSTILLTVGLEEKRWTSVLIYSFTLFLVSVFGLTQFPIYMAIKYRLKRLLKTFKKLIPRGLMRKLT